MFRQAYLSFFPHFLPSRNLRHCTTQTQAETEVEKSQKRMSPCHLFHHPSTGVRLNNVSYTENKDAGKDSKKDNDDERKIDDEGRSRKQRRKSKNSAQKNDLESVRISNGCQLKPPNTNLETRRTHSPVILAAATRLSNQVDTKSRSRSLEGSEMVECLQEPSNCNSILDGNLIKPASSYSKSSNGQNDVTWYGDPGISTRHTRCQSRYTFAHDNISQAKTDIQFTNPVTMRPMKLCMDDKTSECRSMRGMSCNCDLELKTSDGDWEALEVCLRDFHDQRHRQSKQLETCMLFDCNGLRDITAHSIYDELKRFSGVVSLQTLMEIFRVKNSRERMLQFFGSLRCFCTLVSDPKFGIIVIFKGALYLPPYRVKISNPEPCFLFSNKKVVGKNHLKPKKELQLLSSLDSPKLEITKELAVRKDQAAKSPHKNISPVNRFGGNRNNASRRRATLLAMAVPQKLMSTKSDITVSTNTKHDHQTTSKPKREPLRDLSSEMSRTWTWRKRLSIGKENQPKENHFNIKPGIGYDNEDESWRARAKREKSECENRFPNCYTKAPSAGGSRPTDSSWHHVAMKKNRKLSNRATATRERAAMFTLLSQRRMKKCRSIFSRNAPYQTSLNTHVVTEGWGGQSTLKTSRRSFSCRKFREV